MKVLHLSFHNGCRNDIEYVCKELKLDLTFREFDDGMSVGNDKYNVTHEKAENAWKKYKNFYDKFDCIITSDTAPISRVFLQNNWKKKLNQEILLLKDDVDTKIKFIGECDIYKEYIIEYI